MCRAVMLFLLPQRFNLGKRFRYLEHAREVHRKVFKLELFEKISSQKMSFFQNILTTFWVLFLPHFLRGNFFQRPLEYFLWTLRTCSRYLKSLPILDLCVSKKKHDRTTHQQDYMSGKVKKVEILKKWSSKWGENILTKPHDFNILQLCVVKNSFTDFKSKIRY